jgi:hypothetical protein
VSDEPPQLCVRCGAQGDAKTCLACGVDREPLVWLDDRSYRVVSTLDASLAGARNRAGDALIGRVAGGMLLGATLSVCGVVLVAIVGNRPDFDVREWLGVLVIFTIGAGFLAALHYVVRRSQKEALRSTYRATSTWYEILAGMDEGKLYALVGRVVLEPEPPVVGAELSASLLHRSDVAMLGRSIDEDPRDVLIAGALAGMVLRGEIAIVLRRERNWSLGGATRDVDEYVVAGLRIAPRSGTEEREPEAVERAVGALFAAASAEPVLLPYRAASVVATPRPPETHPLKDVWRAAWAVAALLPDPAPAAGETIQEVRARYREWAAHEPRFHAAIVALGREHRGEPPLARPVTEPRADGVRVE